MTAATMPPSQAYLDESRAWDDLSSMMKEMISNSNTTADELQDDLDRGTSLITTLMNEKQSLRTQAQTTASSITTKIESETNAFQAESTELANQIRTVQSLEEQLARETKRASELNTQINKIQHSIDSYKSETDQEIGAMDEMENKHMRQLDKIRRTISMYANMTNIKWDYGRADVLAGEVSLPKKAVHRRFCVEKNIGEVEIAEKIWGFIEG